MTGQQCVTGDMLTRARRKFEQTGPLGYAIAAASRPLAHLNDKKGAVVIGRQITADQASHMKALHHGLPGIEEKAIETLWNAISAEPALGPAFEVILLRALKPLDGLLTYPADVLFDPHERATLARLEADDFTPAAQLRGAVTGIVKITRICNLRCSYCHDWRTGPDAVMDFATLAATIRWLTAGSRARRVHIVLHGGEPSLIGPRGLLTLLALQARYRLSNQEIVTRMQTNGKRLTPAFLAALVQFDVVTSVSLDGPPEVHNRTRPTTKGVGSSDTVRHSIARLRQAGVLNGTLIVVTPELVEHGPRRLLTFLAQEGITDIGLLPMRPAAGAPPGSHDTLAMEVFCQFMLEVENLRRLETPTLRVRELDALYAALLGLTPRTCELQGHCVGSYFAIEPNGAVSHCDKFFGDERYVLGRIDQPFEDVAEGAIARTLRASARKASQDKAGCQWWRYCRGWCPHEDYVARRHGSAADCCGLAPLFAGLEQMGPPPALAAAVQGYRHAAVR
ncbi:uncharacterized protein SAMN05216337_1007173 [Bradyrhizobium brasilense]|uniref:Radical SAM core domain-containing protein n=1 Tax=Bradyrhizobium brasilense TaxID=1419277 RepID=A0A1G6S016_9BRAD|nr:radical SAM protein [Bradyrhizobium brasilense]SDD09517.1 uncharacterized protein SAMN05216337_1007173 [Bradyrhizobium brasilense]